MLKDMHTYLKRLRWHTLLQRSTIRRAANCAKLSDLTIATRPLGGTSLAQRDSRRHEAVDIAIYGGDDK